MNPEKRVYIYSCLHSVKTNGEARKIWEGCRKNNNTCYKTRQYSLIEISDLELEGNDDSWANFLKYVCIFSFFT